jgi:hypothetical protein
MYLRLRPVSKSKCSCSVEVSNVDDVIRHLYLLLYNTLELKSFFKGNDLVVDKLEAVRKSVDDAVDVIE